MRITKDPEERRNEILDAAGHLFITKGYNSVSILDIAKEIGVAKGTIFYYFKSKEELLDATFLKVFEKVIANAQIIVADKNLSAIEKLMKLTDIDIVTGRDAKLKEFFETSPPPGNHDMTLKRLVLLITAVSVHLADVIKQGINEKTMYTRYPDEVAEILMAAEKTLFIGLFEFTPEAIHKKMIALLHVFEIVLNLEDGVLMPVAEKYIELTKLFGI